MKNNQSNMIKSYSKISFIEMMKFSGSNIINRTITLFVLSCYMLTAFGCANQSSSIEKESIEMEESVDISCELDMSYIKENALIYEDLAFLSDEYNHVIQLENDQVSRYCRYPLVSFHAENYDQVIGMDIFQAVKYIGCPSFIGLKNEPTLEYSNIDYTIRKIHLNKENQTYIVQNVEAIRKDSIRPFIDENAEIPTLENAKKLKVGMCVDDVIKTLNTKLPPARPTSSGVLRDWSIPLDDEHTLEMNITDAFEVDCDHHVFDVSNFHSVYYYYLSYFRITGTDIEDYGNYRDYLPIYVDETDNRFSDDSKITLDYLKENNCFFYRDYVFASDKKNHVFKVLDNQIVSHQTYDKVTYPRHLYDLFDLCKNMDFEDSFERFGIPTFSLEKDSLTLIYVMPNNFLVTMTLEEKDGKLVWNEPHTKVNNLSFVSPNVWEDSRRALPVEDDDLSKLKKGMCIADVCTILGKPKKLDQMALDNALKVFHYPYKDNKEVILTFEYKKITKECEHALIMDDFGYDAKNKEYIQRNHFYLYLEDVSISDIK